VIDDPRFELWIDQGELVMGNDILSDRSEPPDCQRRDRQRQRQPEAARRLGIEPILDPFDLPREPFSQGDTGILSHRGTGRHPQL
jgi:hypothetical protein